MKLFSLPLPFLLTGLLLLIFLYIMAGPEDVLLKELGKALFIIPCLLILQFFSKPTILK